MIGPLRGGGEGEPPQQLRKEKIIEGKNLQKKCEPLRSRGGGDIDLRGSTTEKGYHPLSPPKKISCTPVLDSYKKLYKTNKLGK